MGLDFICSHMDHDGDWNYVKCNRYKKISNFFNDLLFSNGMVYNNKSKPIIFKINLLPQAVGMNGIWLLVSGGLAYTIGVIFYVLQNKIKYMHSIWHLWILVGSILHFLCIILYVL